MPGPLAKGNPQLYKGEGAGQDLRRANCPCVRHPQFSSQRPEPPMLCDLYYHLVVSRHTVGSIMEYMDLVFLSILKDKPSNFKDSSLHSCAQNFEKGHDICIKSSEDKEGFK